MRRYCVFLILMILVFSTPSRADDCDEVVALNALYGVRELMIRDASSYTIDRRIDEQIDAFRDPLPEGGYRWVRLVRPESGGGPYERERHFVQSDSDSSPDVFEAVSPRAWAVAVVVPRKRSLFRKNRESWIGDVTITCSADGRSETKRESIRRWMQPDTSHTVDLGTIAERCRVQVEATTKSEFLDGKALVEIHIRQAIEEDHPDNPNYETIQVLKRVRSSTTPETLDYEISRLERRLFPDLYSYPFATLLAETREAQKLLLSESEEDREKGAAILEEVVKDLKKN